MMKTVLLVEDNEIIMNANKEAFELEGYSAITALNLKEAWEAFCKQVPDIIILDIMLPDGSGIDFCHEIRKKSAVPILFLTCLDDKKQVIEGLVSGGDDYITKPYDIDELIARVQASIRRVQLNTANNSQPIAIGNITFDTKRRQAYVNDKTVFLTPKEFDLLMLLYQRLGQAVSSDEIYECIWGQKANDDTRTIAVRIHHLKRKLQISDIDGVDLQYVRGKGYVLTVD